MMWLLVMWSLMFGQMLFSFISSVVVGGLDSHVVHKARLPRKGLSNK